MKLFQFAFSTTVFGKDFISKACCTGISITFQAQATNPQDAIQCPIEYPFPSFGLFCYCCCRYDGDIKCDIDEPFPKIPNPEGVQLMEADDNHIDKSESILCYCQRFDGETLTSFTKLDVCATTPVWKMEGVMNACITKKNFNTNADDHGNLGRLGTTLIRMCMNLESHL